MGIRATSIAIIGGGKMGGAILAGWIGSQEGAAASIGPEAIVVVNPGEVRRNQLASEYQVTCVADVSELPLCNLVVLAVKPQVMFDMLASLKDNPAYAGSLSDTLFVSIAAGLGTDRLQAALPEGARLVRVMPNTPLLVGQGAAAVCASASSTDEDVAYVADLFGCMGTAVVVDEADIDAVCALSGSGPAYVAWLVECMRDAAVRQGLEAALAEKLALQTVLGTAQLIAETGVTPESCREAVCSPGGTTLAALDAMQATGFAESVDAGVAAAVRRSKELAQC